MTEPQWHNFPLETDASLRLTALVRRLLPVPTKPKRAVLLVPGANSSSDTFTVPNGGLVRVLAEHNCDVWTLDWRASPLVLNQVLQLPRETLQEVEDERAAFSLDRMVHEDLAAALTFLRSQVDSRIPLSVHGHCVGGGGVAMAIARGLLEPFGVDRVVLSTLGLFYEVPPTTWIKAEDFLLEAILLPRENAQFCRAIDPRRPDLWPKNFGDAYKAWPGAWLPKNGTKSDDFLRQLSFMVGQPYSRDRVDPGIEGEPIERIFGPLHLGLYTHLGQMVRRGYCAAINDRDQIDRVRLRRDEPARHAPSGDFKRDFFEPYQITLVAAGDNGVWHRDSIDLMFEWLKRSPKMHCEKFVARDKNIQELYWAPDAARSVYPVFAEALGAVS